MASCQLSVIGSSCLPSFLSSSFSLFTSKSVSTATFPVNQKCLTQRIRQKQTSFQRTVGTNACQSKLSENDLRLEFEGEKKSAGDFLKWETAGKSLVAIAATAGILFGSTQDFKALADDEFQIYYGTAASASSYGGYGGNANKKDSAEYIYDVPSGWKERNISKVEKGTNGTDSEFFNPKKRTEKVYVTFLSGFRRLPPQDNVLTNLALSDVNLQDQIATADEVVQTTRNEDGQLYYDFEIESPVGHSLISVTCTNNKLYAHFVNAPSSDWTRDQSALRRIHESFKTVVGSSL